MQIRQKDNNSKSSIGIIKKDLCTNCAKIYITDKLKLRLSDNDLNIASGDCITVYGNNIAEGNAAGQYSHVECECLQKEGNIAESCGNPDIKIPEATHKINIFKRLFTWFRIKME
jgi:hypothetical protein